MFIFLLNSYELVMQARHERTLKFLPGQNNNTNSQKDVDNNFAFIEEKYKILTSNF